MDRALNRGKTADCRGSIDWGLFRGTEQRGMISMFSLLETPSVRIGDPT
jgi:hypothetical protein